MSLSEVGRCEHGKYESEDQTPFYKLLTNIIYDTEISTTYTIYPEVRTSDTRSVTGSLWLAVIEADLRLRDGGKFAGNSERS